MRLVKKRLNNSVCLFFMRGSPLLLPNRKMQDLMVDKKVIANQRKIAGTFDELSDKIVTTNFPRIYLTMALVIVVLAIYDAIVDYLTNSRQMVFQRLSHDHMLPLATKEATLKLTCSNVTYDDISIY